MPAARATDRVGATTPADRTVQLPELVGDRRRLDRLRLRLEKIT
jgi:hypothetical protein